VLSAGALALAATLAVGALVAQRGPSNPQIHPITIDYPAEGSIFPPEFPPPTFLWRDPDSSATAWMIEVAFRDGSPAVHVRAPGERMRIGEIDARCVAPSNEPPKLTAEQANARTWQPDAETWAAIKRHSAGGAATIAITGYATQSVSRAVSRGKVGIETSADPVGAPIFYRDVPLMPSELEKGVIKPLAASAVPLVAWRLRNVAQTRSRLLLEGLHSCANCHSFSRDGKTMGIDIDGPQNEKGLYAIVPVRPRMSISNENVVAWSTFRGKLGSKLRVGFMSQVSPDGQYVVTTINDPGVDQSDSERRKYPQDLIQNYYVANFKNYRFLQVFYPTRGVLAWYSRATGMLQVLPGADDPHYVQTDGVWSPDGKYLIFARAQAKDAYPAGTKPAEYPNDPNETRVQYDLYRIPFNEGRGGRPEPIPGASADGMSNTFPKVSPDGRWIVFVKCRNGQLMRPDSQLYIVSVNGGAARRMRCNTPLMNSWHSFSPNGRWLVFSSKSRSLYTQMYLTHLDENGNDSPAILIENATAANRAVNIPEFVNIPSDGLMSINAPVAEYYRILDAASELARKGQYGEAIPEWKKALELHPEEARPHLNLGVALVETGAVEEAIAHYRKAIELDPKYAEAHDNLGIALGKERKASEAVAEFEKALELNPTLANAHTNLGAALAQQGRVEEALPHFEKAVEYGPEKTRQAQFNLGAALAVTGRLTEAIPHLEEAVQLSGGRDTGILGILADVYARAGRYADAIQTAGRALTVATQQKNRQLIESLNAKIDSYNSRMQETGHEHK
jgi:tetratricopeptide (TPR) repeat protein